MNNLIGLAIIVIGVFIVVLGLLFLFPPKSEFVSKADIIKAMSGDWNRFYFKGVNDKPYYEADDIDARIKKLKGVLKSQ